MNHTITTKKGFAMLFTVLIVTLILSIALGISNAAFKQTVLSSLAKDSQVAFYQADTAVECGLYYDTVENMFPRGRDIGDVIGSSRVILCGDMPYEIDVSLSSNDFLVYSPQDPQDTLPCSSVVFDKLTPEIGRVQGRGYNVCGSSPRQLERGLEVQYDLI